MEAVCGEVIAAEGSRPLACTDPFQSPRGLLLFFFFAKMAKLNVFHNSLKLLSLSSSFPFFAPPLLVDCIEVIMDILYCCYIVFFSFVSYGPLCRNSKHYKYSSSWVYKWNGL